MRSFSVFTALIMAPVGLAADGIPKASRVIEASKTTFPAESIPAGVKLLTGLLESCLYADDAVDGTAQDTIDKLTKARNGDHVQFVFPKPLIVSVLNREVEVSRVIHSDGSFWLVCGKDVVRCAKYTHDKWEPFHQWYRQTLPAD